MFKKIICASLLVASTGLIACNDIKGILLPSGETVLVAVEPSPSTSKSGSAPTSGSGVAPSATPVPTATPSPTPTLVSAPTVTFKSGTGFKAVLQRFRRH